MWALFWTAIPSNNFLKRALAFNPDGALNGARRIAFAGTYAYVLCDRGLAVVDLDNPLQPKLVAQIGAPDLDDPRGIAVQFRYAFVVDRAGMKVLDITNLARPVLVPNALIPLADARNIYVARTYAYISAGKQGMAIVNVEAPERPQLDQMFDAGGKLNDTNDIKIGMVSSSQFAFVADGHNGLQVVQLFSPQATPNFFGFAPKPVPKLIAGYRTKEPALAISRGIDRDRAADETGHQLAVFGRRGSRPFNLEEMQRLYLRNGKLFTVTDSPPGPATEPPVQKSAEAVSPVRAGSELRAGWDATTAQMSDRNLFVAWAVVRQTSRLTSLPCPQGIEIELALQRLLLPPIMIAVAFITSAFGSRLHRPSLFMTSAAGLNSGQIDLSRLSALHDPGVARLAGHHAMGRVIEFGVQKPASRDYRLDGCW